LWGEIAAGRPIEVCEQDEEVLIPEEFLVNAGTIWFSAWLAIAWSMTEYLMGT